MRALDLTYRKYFSIPFHSDERFTHSVGLMIRLNAFCYTHIGLSYEHQCQSSNVMFPEPVPTACIAYGTLLAVQW